MTRKPRIAIVGAGRLGTALALHLKRAGYQVSEVVSRSSVSARRGRTLARKVGAHSSSGNKAHLDADLVWFCVPDREITAASRQLASTINWKGKSAFHSSGALSSEELKVLHKRGATVASVHPLMTFVHGSIPSLKGVPFAIEGDAAAVRKAQRIARDLGGDPFVILKRYKAPYHAWGAFASPLVIAALVTAERVAGMVGLPAAEARRKMLPIVKQTLANYQMFGPAGAFSGPIVRGDAETVRQHLRTLKKLPDAREVYLALARAALQFLPSRNRKELGIVLASRSMRAPSGRR